MTSPTSPRPSTTLVGELGTTPLIGFAGAPFTLASYLIEGGPSRHHDKTRALMYGEPVLWHALMQRLTAITTSFLEIQVTAGAAAVQLFDSWVGALAPADYREFVSPYTSQIFAALAAYDVPRIHFGVGTGELLGVMRDAGADVVGVDWRVPLDEAATRVSAGTALQGNLDPAVLLAPWERGGGPHPRRTDPGLRGREPHLQPRPRRPARHRPRPAGPPHRPGPRSHRPLIMAWDVLKALRPHAQASIVDVNDGITSAAGIAEGFVSAGASTRTLLLAGAAVILAGGSAVAGARYTEVRTEWEVNRALLEEERASIEADPAGELEELVGIYEAKGLDPRLARQVAEALTELDPVAAHVDAELRLEKLGPKSEAVPATVTAGLSYGIGAAVPLVAMRWLPLHDRLAVTFVIILIALALTGCFAAWLTGLPVLRLVRRNVLLGAAIMSVGILVGLALH